MTSAPGRARMFASPKLLKPNCCNRSQSATCEVGTTHVTATISYILVKMRKQIVLLGLGIVLLTGIYSIGKQADEQPDSHNSAATSSGFNRSEHSLTDPASIWAAVNKQRPLNPRDYVPNDLQTPNVALRLPAASSSMKLRAEAAQGLEKLFSAAERNGTPLRLSSAYRSYVYQVSLYSGYVEKEGQGAADAESARPGYSEHQTGLAADVGNLDGACEVERCFGDSPTGKWVAAHAYTYGFIVRYPPGLRSVTGYEYEPWHLRYVGVDLATEMHKTGTQTLEQFFGLESAPDY